MQPLLLRCSCDRLQMLQPITTGISVETAPSRPSVAGQPLSRDARRDPGREARHRCAWTAQRFRLSPLASRPRGFLLWPNRCTGARTVARCARDHRGSEASADASRARAAIIRLLVRRLVRRPPLRHALRDRGGGSTAGRLDGVRQVLSLGAPSPRMHSRERPRAWGVATSVREERGRVKQKVLCLGQL